MKLERYLKTNNITQYQFAALLNVSQGVISNYTSGARIPRPEMLQRIYEATNGQVTPNDFYDIPFITQDGTAIDSRGQSVPITQALQQTDEVRK